MSRRAWTLMIISLFSCMFISQNAAGGINFFSDFEYVLIENTNKDKVTGTRTDTTGTGFTQLYNLQLEQQIYPNLRFRGGGLFEHVKDEISTDGVDTDREKQTIRPFLELSLRTPVYAIGGGYSKTEIKRSGSLIATERQYSDLYNANLQWRPLDLPRISASFQHNTLYDEPKTYETVNKNLTVDTSYGYKNLSLRHGYTRNETEEKESDFATLSQGHNGRISYFHLFFDRKVRLNTNYQIRYRTTDFSGTGDGLTPIPRIEGFFVQNEDTNDPPVIKDGLTDGPDNPTDINIGATGVTNRIGMGLDFGLPHSVDTLFLWVDRDISDVADFFQWEIWITPEDTACRNVLPTDWTPHATVFPATFSEVRNRFEISFAEVETRCIKVVTTPLDITADPAGRFSDIFVTELESFATISAFGRPRTSSTDQSFRVGTSWKISPNTTVGYELSLATSESDPQGTDDSSLSNLVNVRHVFNKTFSGYARVMRTDRRRKDPVEERESTDHSYGATISAAWLPTFGQTLTYSGRHDRSDFETQRSDSIILRNHALLYKGWSVFLDTGYVMITRSEGEDIETSYVRTGTHVAPHRRITLNLNYTVTWQDTGFDTRRKDTANGQLFLLPFDTLSLSSTGTYVKDEDETRWNQNYSANWAPFPGGAVRFSIFYAASQSDGTVIEKRETQSYGPRLEWRITTWSSLRILYTVSETETDLRSSDSQNFRANLRIAL